MAPDPITTMHAKRDLSRLQARSLPCPFDDLIMLQQRIAVICFVIYENFFSFPSGPIRLSHHSNLYRNWSPSCCCLCFGRYLACCRSFCYAGHKCQATVVARSQGAGHRDPLAAASVSSPCLEQETAIIASDSLVSHEITPPYCHAVWGGLQDTFVDAISYQPCCSSSSMSPSKKGTSGTQPSTDTKRY